MRCREMPSRPLQPLMRARCVLLISYLSLTSHILHLTSCPSSSMPSCWMASQARCYHNADRHKLLAVIEAGFGSFDPFNKIVRGLIKDKVMDAADPAPTMASGAAAQQDGELNA
jgi:hypothetical protein